MGVHPRCSFPHTPQWSCCGARGPNDWNLNIYFNCTDLNPSRERCGVPFSCCVRNRKVRQWGGQAQPGAPGVSPHPTTHWPVSSQEDVLNTQCGYDVRLKLVRSRADEAGEWVGRQFVPQTDRQPLLSGGF